VGAGTDVLVVTGCGARNEELDISKTVRFSAGVAGGADVAHPSLPATPSTRSRHSDSGT
jgi:hypothetical protein